METNNAFTKEPTAGGETKIPYTQGEHTDGGVLLSKADAEEFRLYKRKQKMLEASAALACSGVELPKGADIQRVCERAIRLKQAAVRVPLTRLAQAKYYLGKSGVKLDCTVGGNGETLSKVKACEARMAVKRGAKEITLFLTPSYLDACRYGELRREMKRVRRVAKKAALKIRVERTGSPTTLSRVARIASEIKADYISVPYFVGCQRLRMDLTNGCKLEVTGVSDSAVFRDLLKACVERVVTDKGWELYMQWLEEAYAYPLQLRPAYQEPQKQEEIGKEKETSISCAAKLLQTGKRETDEKTQKQKEDELVIL